MFVTRFAIAKYNIVSRIIWRVWFVSVLFRAWKTETTTAMDAIKKKMQAMKLEKDNALDRAAFNEQQAKDANLRAEKVCNTFSWNYSIITYFPLTLLTVLIGTCL